jgi:hypothetical protein
MRFDNASKVNRKSGVRPGEPGAPVQFPSQRKRCLEGNNPSAAEAELILKAFNLRPESRTLQKNELLERPVGDNRLPMG